MAKKCNIGLLCIVLIVSLLAGCANGASNYPTDLNGEDHAHSIGALAVYAPEKYKAALQQVFSHINLSQTEFHVSWTEDFLAADVVITDNLPLEGHRDYRLLHPEELQVQGIEQLMVRFEQGVIGLPLFLHLDSFWYDQQLYDNNGIEPPQSRDSWQLCTLNGQYPVLCDETDMCSLFWSVVAPYYLKFGGSTEDLAEGNFQYKSLFDALEMLKSMGDEGMIQLSEQAWQSFTATQAAYWVAGVDDVAAYYNFMSNRSSWKPAISFPFGKQEKTVCVVRADVLAVRKTADATLTDTFLKLFYEQQILAELSTYSKMPLACRINYAPATVPVLPQVCYTLLSSPTLDVTQISCVWSEGRQQQIYNLLFCLMNGSIDAAAAAEQMMQ